MGGRRVVGLWGVGVDRIGVGLRVGSGLFYGELVGVCGEGISGEVIFGEKGRDY